MRLVIQDDDLVNSAIAAVIDAQFYVTRSVPCVVDEVVRVT